MLRCLKSLFGFGSYLERNPVPPKERFFSSREELSRNVIRIVSKAMNIPSNQLDENSILGSPDGDVFFTEAATIGYKIVAPLERLIGEIDEDIVGEWEDKSSVTICEIVDYYASRNKIQARE